MLINGDGVATTFTGLLNLVSRPDDRRDRRER
jgi:hypothetical protein